MDAIKQEQARVEAEKVREVEPVQQVIEAAPVMEHETVVAPAPVIAEEVRVIDFRVWATQTQLGKIRDFLITNNIKYGKVN
jgi:hypothetical protein